MYDPFLDTGRCSSGESRDDAGERGGAALGAEEGSLQSAEDGPAALVLGRIARVSAGGSLPLSGEQQGGADPLVGRRLAQFEVLERIGAGGMGIIYKAQHCKLRRQTVALKVMKERPGCSAHRGQLLEREAQNADAVSHPNVARIFDIAEWDGVTFVVMEYVEGKPLGHFLQSSRVDLHEVARYALQIAEGLAAAHAAGVIHRDLSPNNVMITTDRSAKILDFGLSTLLPGARTVADAAALASAPASVAAGAATVGRGGTPGYMSPEQEANEPVDARSDVYSFGILLREMTARCPRRHRDQRRRAALERVIERCTRRDPRNRFADGSALAAALRPITRDRNSARRAMALGGAAALVAGVVVAFAARVSASGDDTTAAYVHVPGKSGPGCAADEAVTLRAAAYMPTPSSPSLRFFVTRDDERPWLAPGKLTLFVGDGPTCARKPHNIVKATADIVPGNTVQTINMSVKPYDGEWTVGEEKRFWIGSSEGAWLAFRTSGPVVVQRVAPD
ncbi:serine/threonine-protein kinase [Sorangium sp. So ce1036]|uniref:serine/threonine-protein kinase n=1 Tax=Sorangium sp. So ce1036 TaxID=3133328 RepID=UPI003F0C0476